MFVDAYENDEVVSIIFETNDSRKTVKLRESAFKPDYIQQVYWGNYWGEHLKEQVNLEELRKLPVSCLKETEKGVFFTLSDSIFDFKSRQCNALRKKVWSKVIKNHKLIVRLLALSC